MKLDADVEAYTVLLFLKTTWHTAFAFVHALLLKLGGGGGKEGVKEARRKKDDVLIM